MTMATAPLFDRAPHWQVTGAYRAWADHYNKCTTCQRGEWYDPPIGEPDFCERGKQLFRAWVQAAHISHMPLSARGHSAE